MKDLAQTAEAVTWLGTTYRTILSAEASGGALSIVDIASPLGASPPRHVHDAEDEYFIVLEGQLEFWLEGERFTRGPGEAAMVPRGKEHSFRVIGTGPARHLIVLTPGGFEQFFVDMARGQFRIPEDMPQVLQSAESHALRFTGPPLEA